jgi:hypothetical protein
MIDPTSRQRGHPTETRQQLSHKLRTESNIWSQVSEGSEARYLDILADRQLKRDFDFDFNRFELRSEIWKD